MMWSTKLKSRGISSSQDDINGVSYFRTKQKNHDGRDVACEQAFLFGTTLPDTTLISGPSVQVIKCPGYNGLLSFSVL